MALIDDLREAINLSHAYAWDKSTLAPSNPDEPTLVSAFLATPTQDAMKWAFRQALPSGWNMRLMGIFTHQTPVVKPVGALNGVEIADLMLIRQHINPQAGTSAGRALLLQAKKGTSSDIAGLASGNPGIQFDLYKNWPKFLGTKRLPANPAGNIPWDFNMGGAANQRFGQYLAVYDGHAFDWAQSTAMPPHAAPVAGSVLSASNYAGSPIKTTWAAGDVSTSASNSNPLSCSTDFARLLEDFSSGNVGEAFTLGAAATDHWSIFVNTMLTYATAKSQKYNYTLKAAGVSKPKGRAVEIQAFMQILPYMISPLTNILLFEEYLRRARSPRNNARQRSLSSLIEQLGWSEYDSAFEADLLKYAMTKIEGAGIEGDGKGIAYPPPNFLDEDDGGHVPVFVFATTGPETPPGLIEMPSGRG